MGTCRCRFCRAFSINSRFFRQNGRISKNCFVLSRYQRAQRNHNNDENENIRKTKTLKVQHICDRRHFNFVRNTHTEAQPLKYTVPERVPVKKCTNSRFGYEFVQPILNLVLLCVLTGTGCVDCLQLLQQLGKVQSSVAIREMKHYVYTNNRSGPRGQISLYFSRAHLLVVYCKIKRDLPVS